MVRHTKWLSLANFLEVSIAFFVRQKKYARRPGHKVSRNTFYLSFAVFLRLRLINSFSAPLLLQVDAVPKWVDTTGHKNWKIHYVPFFHWIGFKVNLKLSGSLTKDPVRLQKLARLSFWHEKKTWFCWFKIHFICSD